MRRCRSAGPGQPGWARSRCRQPLSFLALQRGPAPSCTDQPGPPSGTECSIPSPPGLASSLPQVLGEVGGALPALGLGFCVGKGAAPRVSVTTPERPRRPAQEVPPPHGLTLVGSEMLSHLPRTSRGRTECHLTQSLKVVQRKRDGGRGVVLHSLLGHPARSGALFPPASLRVQCAHPGPVCRGLIAESCLGLV